LEGDAAATRAFLRTPAVEAVVGSVSRVESYFNLTPP